MGWDNPWEGRGGNSPSRLSKELEACLVKKGWLVSRDSDNAFVKAIAPNTDQEYTVHVGSGDSYISEAQFLENYKESVEYKLSQERERRKRMQLQSFQRGMISPEIETLLKALRSGQSSAPFRKTLGKPLVDEVVRSFHQGKVR